MSLLRNDKIDMFRCLGILLVVLGHTQGLPSEIHRYIYSFHMPAFFVLSGYLFNIDKARRFPVVYGVDKFRRLIIPAWCLGAICGLPFVIKLAIHKISLAIFLSLLWGAFVGFPRADGNFLSTPLWFLFCLYCLEMMAAVVAQITVRFAGPSMIVVGVIGLASSGSLPFIPFDIHIALSAAFYFGIGMLVKESGALPFEPSERSMARACATAGLATAWALLTSVAWEPISMSDSSFGSTISSMSINVISALLGTMMLCQIATNLPDARALRGIGTRTLPILGFNYVVSAGVVHFLNAIHANQWGRSFVMQAAILVAIAWSLDRAGSIGDVLNGRRRQKAHASSESRPPSARSAT